MLLLYASESWAVTQRTRDRFQFLYQKCTCLRKIVKNSGMRLSIVYIWNFDKTHAHHDVCMNWQRPPRGALHFSDILRPCRATALWRRHYVIVTSSWSSDWVTSSTGGTRRHHLKNGSASTSSSTPPSTALITATFVQSRYVINFRGPRYDND